MKIIYLFLIHVLLCGILLAQDKDTGKRTNPAIQGKGKKGLTFKTPNMKLPETKPADTLKINDIKVQLLGKTTQVGKPGDYLLTLLGSGFVESSISPQLHLGEKLKLSVTFVNSKGNELYIVLSKDSILPELKKITLNKITIQNPGYRKDNTHLFDFKISKNRLFEIDSLVPKVVLIHGKYFIEKKVMDD